jgi:hypothetical protein
MGKRCKGCLALVEERDRLRGENAWLRERLGRYERPRRLVISHLQGDSDVVEVGGGEASRFVESFGDDDAARAFIDSVEGGKVEGR